MSNADLYSSSWDIKYFVINLWDKISYNITVCNFIKKKNNLELSFVLLSAMINLNDI